VFARNAYFGRCYLNVVESPLMTDDQCEASDYQGGKPGRNRIFSGTIDRVTNLVVTASLHLTRLQ